jgi:hypothetical protein
VPGRPAGRGRRPPGSAAVGQETAWAASAAGVSRDRFISATMRSAGSSSRGTELAAELGQIGIVEAGDARHRDDLGPAACAATRSRRIVQPISTIVTMNVNVSGRIRPNRVGGDGAASGDSLLPVKKQSGII